MRKCRARVTVLFDRQLFGDVAIYSEFLFRFFVRISKPRARILNGVEAAILAIIIIIIIIGPSSEFFASIFGIGVPVYPAFCILLLAAVSTVPICMWNCVKCHIKYL